MYKKIVNAINSASKITIFSHINVDGDGVGSSLALFNYCKSLGKDVCVSIESTMPSHIMWLKDIDKVNFNCNYYGDLAIIVDCNNKDRIGSKKFKLSKFKQIINIDHHQDNTFFGDLNLVCKGYSSACEVIFDLFKNNKIAITSEIAEPLVAGILTDTGNLSYNSATSNTFRKVADLLDILNEGINTFTQPLFSSNSMNIFELKKRVYENIEFLNDNSFALFAIKFNDLQECNVDINDTKALIEIGFSLKPVKVLVAITEGQPGVCYVSFRSKGNIDCSKFASAFGGGGHVNAAGCRIYDNLENVIDSIKKVVKY